MDKNPKTTTIVGAWFAADRIRVEIAHIIPKRHYCVNQGIVWVDKGREWIKDLESKYDSFISAYTKQDQSE